MSLRSQLLLRLIIFSLALVGGVTYLGYKDVVYETQELFDAQLARSARIILSLVQTQDNISNASMIQEYLDENGLSLMYFNFNEQDDETQSDIGHAYETKLAFQIWDNLGNLIIKSYNAPLRPLSEKTSGYSDISLDDSHWRTFSLFSNNKKYRCITAERIDAREDLIKKVSNDIFYMFIILIPTLSLILYLTIDKGIKPLQLLASKIQCRSEKNLNLISMDCKYNEIITIKNALNQLLQRLDDTLSREKRITSDAAHELRTPLAAIRLHTELAKNAKNPEQQIESLNNILQGVDRSTHLVEQLLTLARLEPELLTTSFTQVCLSDLIVEECAQLSQMAINKNIDISFDDKRSDPIDGNESSLRLLIRNLLTNAILYTQPGGNITITISTNSSKTMLIIEDDGPGIAEEDRKHVIERFYRASDNETPGCGIGLSIVNRVVQLHKGSLELCTGSNGRGLKVIVII